MAARLSNKIREPRPEPRPLDFVQKFRFIRSVIYDRRMTALDHNIAVRITERYKDTYGVSRASLRFLEEGTGATRPSVIASLRRLVATGALIIEREGSGTRPSEYRPNIEFGASGIADDTSSGIAGDTTTSGIAEYTSSGVADDTTKRSSGMAGNTESHLPKSTYKVELTVEEDEKDDAGFCLAANPVTFPLPKKWTIVDAGTVEEDNPDAGFIYVNLESEDGDVVDDYFNCILIDGEPADEHGIPRMRDFLLAAETFSEVQDTKDLIGVRIWAFGNGSEEMTYISPWEAHMMLPKNNNEPVKLGRFTPTVTPIWKKSA